MNKRRLIPILALCLLLILPMLSLRAQAAELDEILRYTVTVDVNDDATLRMVYHIDWKVLDSTSDGPLTWVLVGIPNRHYSSLTGRSNAVKSISYSSSDDAVRIDLDRAYYADEVAQIEFEVVQDYLYQVDMLKEGETVYSFTPGWFDDIRIDELVIKWNAKNTLGQTPACLKTPDGYYTWKTSLDKGEQYTVTVTYPNDAYAFDLSREIEYHDSSSSEPIYMILGFLLFMAIPIAIIAAIVRAIRRFARTANFSQGTEQKITRTKVVYYPVCQGCGVARPEGANNCPYCGRSFIKSEEIIKEEDIPKEEKELRKKNTNGLYQYSSQPDTFIRVNVIPVPRPVIHSAPRSSYSSRSSSSSSRSSHSSCAHSSCACACACACAGGGRAGCSVKDFYNTDLKLRQLDSRRRKGLRREA